MIDGSAEGTETAWRSTPPTALASDLLPTEPAVTTALETLISPFSLFCFRFMIFIILLSKIALSVLIWRYLFLSALVICLC